MVVSEFFSMNKFVQLCSEHAKQKLGHKYQSVETACLCYYTLDDNSFSEMIKQCLCFAKHEMNCDAMALMLIMDMEYEALKNQQFEQGDGMLNWYLMNWSFGGHLFRPEELGAFLF